MGKSNKTEMITIRLSPSEKQSAQDLANRLGISTTDVLRLSLINTLNKIDGIPNPTLIDVAVGHGQPIT